MNAASVVTMSRMNPRKNNKVEGVTPGGVEQSASRESETSGERDRALLELAKKLDKLILGWAHQSRPKEERS